MQSIASNNVSVLYFLQKFELVVPPMFDFALRQYLRQLAFPRIRTHHGENLFLVLLVLLGSEQLPPVVVPDDSVDQNVRLHVGRAIVEFVNQKRNLIN